MNQKRLILSSPLLEIVISRLAQQLIETYQDFADTVILGMQPRGIYFAERVGRELNRTLGHNGAAGVSGCYLLPR